MASTSNERIMTEYVVKYAALHQSTKHHPGELLKTLYMADCYRAGKDLQSAKNEYNTAIWDDVSARQIEARLIGLSRFMVKLANNRAKMWGVKL